MAADLVTIATTAALTQFVGPMFKHFGEQALERAKQVAGKASSLLAAVGREPKPVEPKFLLPMVQGAGLEPDETLADKWAALLANAADPTSKIEISPSFAEILRQIGVAEVKIIQRVEERLEGHRRFIVSTFLGSFASSIGMPEEVFGTAVDNLLRLRVCTLPLSRFESDNKGQIIEHPASKDQLEFTALGLAFLAAVTPPTS